jgi:hypothetical protein
MVEIGGTLSASSKITCGVPQGSILGPLLFLIYIYEIPSSVTCKLLLYADDSALIVSGKCVEDIQNRLSSELESVREWLIDNKLSLHLGKTESILFASKRKLNSQNAIMVQCAGKTLTCSTHVKYLGVVLEQSLSGEGMAKKIISKSNAKLKFLYRQAKNVDMETTKILVSALIQCHFDYASTSWYNNLTKHYKVRLQCTQNKIVRFLLNAPARTHIGPLEFSKVRMLPVELRVRQLKLNLAHSIVHGTAPSYLTDNITFAHTIHTHNTRSSSHSHSIHIPQIGSFSKTSFHYTCTTAWNSLPHNIKDVANKSRFKFLCKSLLFDQLSSQDSNPFIFY